MNTSPNPPPTMLHPHHDDLVAAVREWYSRSYPEMGYLRERSRFGFYTRHASSPDLAQATVRRLEPAAVPELLADLRAYFGGRPVTLYIDDRRLDAMVSESLLATGCSVGDEQTFLAHAGPLPQAIEPPGIAVETVTAASLVDYVVTKQKAFADSEDAPAADEVAAEIARREAELAGDGRFLLARLEGEPASVAGWYEGEDRLVFQLGTRLPFRRRGIATHLLCRVLAEGEARRSRSTVINADPHGRPVELYRRLGFTDEVYWRREYRFVPPGA